MLHILEKFGTENLIFFLLKYQFSVYMYVMIACLLIVV